MQKTPNGHLEKCTAYHNEIRRSVCTRVCVCLCLRDACTEISVSSIARCRYLVEAIKLSEMGIMCLLHVWHTGKLLLSERSDGDDSEDSHVSCLSPDFNGQWFCAVHGDSVCAYACGVSAAIVFGEFKQQQQQQQRERQHHHHFLRIFHAPPHAPSSTIFRKQ